jgi:hypothetical protein
MAGAEPEQSRRDLVGMLIAFCLNYGLSWQWYGFFPVAMLRYFVSRYVAWLISDGRFARPV